VSVPHGFREPTVGHLIASDLDIDPLTGTTLQSSVPVTVQPSASPDPTTSTFSNS
jgi:hypothetical protein